MSILASHFHVLGMSIGIGTIIAGALSYQRNSHVVLSILHGVLFGWVYVIWWALSELWKRKMQWF